jgi:hypothetical protein
VDIDADGFADVLSGSWPGELFLFKGGPDHSYAAGEMLKDKDGQLINIGGGIEERGYNGTGTLIRGSVEWETTDEGTFAVYHGKRIKSTPDKPIASTGTASTVHPVDWDGDGDFDLIVGGISGNVWLVPNEGTAKSYAFGKETQIKAGGKLLNVSSRAGPYAADWDGDGDFDLLVGDDDGRVSLYRNTGSAKAPELAAAVQLVPPGKAEFGPQVSKEVVRGSRSKVCVADWNGDGKPDLLVGDLATQKPDRPEPTVEEMAEFDRMRQELRSLQQRYSDLSRKLQGPSSVGDETERKKAEEDLSEVRKQMTDLRSKLPRDYDLHGWVWLFLRK